MTALAAPPRVENDVLRALTTWLGIRPEPGMVRVAASARRVLPGPDGVVRPLVGVAAGPDLAHAVALSVPPRRFPAVAALVDELAPRGGTLDRDGLAARLPGALGLPGRRCTEAVLRWSCGSAEAPAVGRWQRADDPRLPLWLRRLGPTALVALDAQGRFLCGAGVRRRSRLVHEVVVGTAPHARGQGLARALVAQAAARVRDDGALPVCLHLPHNAAGSRVAEAAGFADRGWRLLALDDT